jgi:TPR repeat protein
MSHRSERPDHASALPIAEIEGAAAAGSSWACVELARRFMNGTGGVAQQSLLLAAENFRSAADQGCPDGQCGLGVCLLLGHGVARDEAAAVRHFREAASQGHLPALANLAVCYRDGIGVARDESEAMRLLQEGASRGDGNAMFLLADSLVLRGDRAQAAELYRRVAGMSPCELDDNVVHDALYLKAVYVVREKRVAWAQFSLALFWQDNSGGATAMNREHAAHWLQCAADQGLAEAQHRLAMQHLQGDGVARDQALAIRYLTAAAEQGFRPALFDLALCHEAGVGVRKCMDTALLYFMRVADQVRFHDTDCPKFIACDAGGHHPSSHVGTRGFHRSLCRADTALVGLPGKCTAHGHAAVQQCPKWGAAVGLERTTVEPALRPASNHLPAARVAPRALPGLRELCPLAVTEPGTGEFDVRLNVITHVYAGVSRNGVWRGTQSARAGRQLHHR